MEAPELTSLSDVYMRHHASSRDEDFWAWEEVQRRIKADLAQALEVILTLVERADSDDALSYIAAGPLEDFVDIYGNSALDVIELACQNDQRMQFALSGIWLERESPVLERWRGLMKLYGFMGGGRQPLSKHPDCWF
jgi:hypothetical protein